MCCLFQGWELEPKRPEPHDLAGTGAGGILQKPERELEHKNIFAKKYILLPGL